MNNYQERITTLIRQAAPAPAAEWLDQSLEMLAKEADRENTLLTRSAMARRKLGEVAISDSPAVVDTPEGAFDISHWTSSDGGRLLLLLEAYRLDAGQDWADRLYRHGDEVERAAVVRGLCLLPAPRSLIHIAKEAGRCNSLFIYAVLALNNPYVQHYYDEHDYNQVVLKSLFTGLDIEHICGLQQRANSELSRMCEEYADERLAAGRSVPADIWLAVGPYARPRGEELMLTFLADQDAKHRYYAATAIGRRLDKNPQLTNALAQQLEKEANTVVREVLEKYLQS